MVRVFSHYVSANVLLLVAVEGLVLFFALFAGWEVRYPGGGFAGLGRFLPEATIFAFMILVMMSAVGLYDQDLREPFIGTLRRMVVAFALGLMAMSAVFYVFPQTYVGQGVFLVTTLFAFAGIVLTRVVFTRWSHLGLPQPRVLVLGTGPEALMVDRALRANRGESVSEVVAFHPVRDTEHKVPEEKILPAGLPILEAVRQYGITEIVIAMRERRGGALPLRELLDCKLQGIHVHEISSFFERELKQVSLESLRASWLLFGDGFRQGLVRETIKRVFDVVMSLTLLICSLPVAIVTAIAIAVESPGSIFYRQERVGQGGRTFVIRKFRSMREDAEPDGKPVWAQPNDERTTRVGRFIRKTRIDEIPQLWNVLKGEMSFVGPRPERPHFVQQLTRDLPFYMARHSVKPGVTGWAQVRYPYGSSLEDATQKLQYDLYYVKNNTLFLDLMIAIETIQVVFLGKGAR
jgi:sugar transferase (PEP-CTERM system associated)